MARDPKQLRKAYEYKLGKDLVAKLSDEQIAKLSKYYNSLSPAEQSKVDSELIQGQGEFLDSARSMARKKEVTVDSEPKPTTPKVQSRKKVPIEKGEKTSSKKPSALVIYKPDTKKSEDVIANEDIDPSILSALGLDDGVDIDYDTYKTLLREKMAAGRMTDTKMSSSETKMFTDEYKRTKGKTGKFVVNTNKTNVNKIINSGRALTGGVRGGALVRRDASKQEDNKEQIEDAVTETIPDSFIKVSAALDSINQILARQLNLDKKEADTEKSEAEQAKRESKEKGAEKGRIKSVVTGVANVVKKAPFFDTIMNYLKNIALGSAVLAFMKWLENPENQKKLEDFGNFIVDNLPIIFGGLAAILALNIGAKLMAFLGILKTIAISLGPTLGLIAAGAAAGAQADQQRRQEEERQRQDRSREDQARRESGLPDLTPEEQRRRQTYDDARSSAGRWGDAAGQGGGPSAQAGAAFADWLASQFREPGTSLYLANKEKLRLEGQLESQREREKRQKEAIAKLEEQDPGWWRDFLLSQRKNDLQRAQRRIDELENNIEFANKRIEDIKAEEKEKFLKEHGSGAQLPPHLQDNPTTTPQVQPQEPMVPGTPQVAPQRAALPTATGVGRQGTTQTADYGTGSGAPSKGYIIVPGHAAGGGAPGEMELTPELARNLVENVRKRVGGNVPIRVMDMHSQTADTDAAFSKQQDKLKELEKQGYEVIELHMDASMESGQGTGRGVILPMPGTDEINPVEADFARTSGAFGRKHRGGLAGTNRGVSLIELGNMSPELQEQVLRGQGLSKRQLDALTKPLEDSLIRGMGLEIKAPPTPDVPSPPAQRVSFIPLDGTQPGASPVIASSHASQDTPSVFSPSDPNDSSSLLNRSIYNAPVV